MAIGSLSGEKEGEKSLSIFFFKLIKRGRKAMAILLVQEIYPKIKEKKDFGGKGKIVVISSKIGCALNNVRRVYVD